MSYLVGNYVFSWVNNRKAWFSGICPEDNSTVFIVLVAHLDLMVLSVDGNLTAVSVRNAVCSNEVKECTFSPSINPISRHMVNNAELPETFIERQEHFIDKKRRQEARRQVTSVSAHSRSTFTLLLYKSFCSVVPLIWYPAHEQEERECTFCPATGNTDSVLAASHLAGRLTESAEDRTERLAFKDAESREYNRDALGKHLYSQFTFRPEINPISKRIAKVCKWMSGTSRPLQLYRVCGCAQTNNASLEKRTGP